MFVVFANAVKQSKKDVDRFATLAKTDVNKNIISIKIFNKMEIEDIEKLALLARIELSEEEKQKMVKEMDSILGFVDQIQKADVNITEREAGEVRNIMREDGESHESGIYTEDILKEAPKTREGYVEVKKIL